MLRRGFRPALRGCFFVDLSPDVTKAASFPAALPIVVAAFIRTPLRSLGATFFFSILIILLDQLRLATGARQGNWLAALANLAAVQAHAATWQNVWGNVGGKPRLAVTKTFAEARRQVALFATRTGGEKVRNPQHRLLNGVESGLAPTSAGCNTYRGTSSKTSLQSEDRRIGVLPLNAVLCGEFCFRPLLVLISATTATPAFRPPFRDSSTALCTRANLLFRLAL